MSSDRIVGYTYQAEHLCPRCAAEAVGWNGYDGNPHTHIDKAGGAQGFTVDDERSFDSGDWPKVIFEVQIEDADEQCSACGELLLD